MSRANAHVAGKQQRRNIIPTFFFARSCDGRASRLVVIVVVFFFFDVEGGMWMCARLGVLGFLEPAIFSISKLCARQRNETG